MKKIFQTIFLLLSSIAAYSQGVGINNPTPAASALLDLTSIDKGLLIPRMTAAQRIAISLPATGLIVYDTTLNQIYYFDGSVWRALANGTGWGLLGNSGTNSSTNFVGTTDAASLAFRVRGWKCGYIEYDDGAGGVNAYNASSDNTAIGLGALYLYNGGGAIAGNSAFGAFALRYNTAGWNNTAVGAHSLWQNTTGNNNTAVGSNSLIYNTTGDGNSALGIDALNANVSGSNNTAVGGASLAANTSGSGNSALGDWSLSSNSTGIFNTAIGYGSINQNTTGNNNAALGQNTLYLNTSGNNNVAIGAKALYNNPQGSYLIAIGDSALYNNLGNDATGDGLGNLAIGSFSMFANTTGKYNNAIGRNALRSNTTADFNCAFGDQAMYNNNTGYQNVAIGNSAMLNNTSGFQNTALGEWAGSTNTTGNSNTLIGRSADVTTGTLSNATAIGAGATVSQSNSLILGRISPSINVGIGTTAPVRPLEIASGQLRFSNPLGDIEFTEVVDLLANVTTAAPAATTPVLRVASNSALNNVLMYMQHNGSVGLGTITPNYARLQVQGMVGNTVAYFSGSANSKGLALVSDDPGLYFNCYYNGNTKAMAASGFPSVINSVQSGNGGITFGTSNIANAVADWPVTVNERMRIDGNGLVGIGTANPQYAKVQIHGGVGPTVAMFGADMCGVAIQADNPEVGFNYYYNGSTKTIKAGYAVDMGMSPANGDFYISNFNGNTSATNFGTIAGYQQVVTIKQNGRVGIGTTTPGAPYTLTIAGSALASGGSWVNSDERYKKNTHPINNALASVLKLQGVTYDYKTDEFPKWNFDKTKQIGVIAQEVEKVLPELVKTDDEGYKAVAYERFTPILIEAVKEQQDEIKAQQKEIEMLKVEIEKIKNNQYSFEMLKSKIPSPMLQLVPPFK